MDASLDITAVETVALHLMEIAVGEKQRVPKSKCSY